MKKFIIIISIFTTITFAKCTIDEPDEYRLVKTSNFLSSGEIESYIEYDYDNGYRTGYRYSSSGDLIGYTTYLYDSDGNIIRLESYDLSGELLVYIILDYNKYGNITKESFYNLKDSEHNSQYKYEYDYKNENPIKRYTYDSTGKMIYHSVYEYTKNQVVRSIQYNASDFNPIYTRTKEYDSNGNVRRVNTYDSYFDNFYEVNEYEKVFE